MILLKLFIVESNKICTYNIMYIQVYIQVSLYVCYISTSFDRLVGCLNVITGAVIAKVFNESI